jgi:hypothetical protein
VQKDAESGGKDASFGAYFHAGVHPLVNSDRKRALAICLANGCYSQQQHREFRFSVPFNIESS